MNLLLELPDSELLCPFYIPKEGSLYLFFTLWNEKRVGILFENAIAFSFLSYSNTIGMRIENSNSEFFVQAIRREFDTVPQHHCYICYEFIDVDDMPFIKIVAKTYSYIEDVSVHDYFCKLTGQV